MSAAERPVLFACDGQSMLGMLHVPAAPSGRGVLLVVGGPQYRVGAHRQFLLMARALADEGIAVLRFDCRGMGDSEGRFPGFQRIGDDIRAAMDAFAAECPDLERIALWGLCDAAAALMFYGHTDPRVAGLVLVNPWARTEAGIARAHLRHYYLQRVVSRAFWQRVLRGEFHAGESLASLARHVRDAVARRRPAAPSAPPASPPEEMTSLAELGLGDEGLPDRMRDGLARFAGPVLLLMSGEDLTAREFDDVAGGSRAWRRVMARPGTTRRDLPGADHTFSARSDLDAATRATRDWVRAL